MQSFPLAQPAPVRAGVVYLALLIAAMSAYAPAITGGIIWDDAYLIGHNPFFRSPIFVLEVFHHYLFNESISPYYRPVQNWSYILDYLLFFNNYAGYHITSILWHSLAALLLYCLFLRILPLLSEKFSEQSRLKFWCAAGAALVWAVHPAFNAAVAYVSGRADPLAATFSLGAWLCYEKHQSGGKKFWLLFSGPLWLLALCSRESGLFWLGAFLCYALFFRLSLNLRQRLLPAGICAVTVLFYAWLRTLPGSSTAGAFWDSSLFLPRLQKSVLALGDYANLLVAPVRLTMERSLEGDFADDVLLLISAIAFLVFAAAAVFLPGSGARLRRFGILWFFIGFLPVSPMLAHTADVAEHWMYMPMVGLLLSAAGFAPLMSFKLRTVAVVLLALWVPLLGMRTWLRSRDWQTQFDFYRQTAEEGGYSIRVLSNMAREFQKAGRYAEGEKLLRSILKKYPGNGLIQVYLGINLHTQQRYEEALRYLKMTPKKMRKLAPLHPSFFFGPLFAAKVLEKLDRQEEALEQLRRGSEVWPHQWRLIRDYAAMLQAQEQPEEAERVVREFLDERWWHLDARLALARLLAQQQKFAEAHEVLKKAAWLDVHDGRAFELSGRLYADENRHTLAIEQQEKVIHRGHETPLEWLRLAQYYETKGDLAKAEEAVARANAIRSEVVQ